jgi:hypothetical protein
MTRTTTLTPGDAPSLLGILVHIVVRDADCGVQAMAGNLLETLLDPETHSSFDPSTVWSFCCFSNRFKAYVTFLNRSGFKPNSDVYNIRFG